MRCVALALVALVAFIALGASAASANDDHDRVALVVVRAAGTGACPDDAALSARVRARLGFDPFARTSAAARRLRVELAPVDSQVLEARIALTARDGTSLGRRVLRGDATCDELANDLVLAIAIAIDPLLLMRHPPAAATTVVPPETQTVETVRGETARGETARGETARVDDDVALRALPPPTEEEELRDILPGESELPPQWAPVAAAGGAALGYGVGLLAGQFLTGGSNAANAAWSHSDDWSFILFGLGVPILPAIVVAFSTTFMFMDVRASAAVGGVSGAVVFASHAALLALGVIAPPGAGFEGVALVTVAALAATAAGATAVMMPMQQSDLESGAVVQPDALEGAVRE